MAAKIFNNSEDGRLFNCREFWEEKIALLPEQINFKISSPAAGTCMLRLRLLELNSVRVPVPGSVADPDSSGSLFN